MDPRNLSRALFVSLFVLSLSASLDAQQAVPASQPQPLSVEGIAVAVVTPGGEVLRSRTDARGQFAFPLDGPGQYDLLFFPEGTVPTGAAMTGHREDSQSNAATRAETWHSFAGWPYRFSVGALRTQIGVPAVSEASIGPDQPLVPAIRVPLVVSAAGKKTASGATLRGRVLANDGDTAALSPEPPKFAKVKVVKNGDKNGCKGDVWISNGAGKWENNCARGEACCDLSSRYDTTSRELSKNE